MTQTGFHPPSSILLYDGGRTEALDLKEISKYLQEKLGGVEVVLRPDIFVFYLSRSSEPEGRQTVVDLLAKELASIKVRDLTRPNLAFEPLSGEIDYEKGRLLNPQKKVFGILYDGFRLQRSLSRLIPEEEDSLEHLHIVFTNQLFGTWDLEDRRFHARVSVYGFPAVISTTGVVEAPAKPREFYLMKQQLELLGTASGSLSELKKSLRDRFIDHDDHRLTEVLKGYVMQALFFHATGDPFCEDRDCRLYNAHWQEEVIRAQLNSRYEFCPRHREMLDSWFGR